MNSAYPPWAQQPTEQVFGTAVPSSCAKYEYVGTSSSSIMDFSELRGLRMENNCRLESKRKALFSKALRLLIIAHVVGFLLLAAFCLQPHTRDAVGSGMSIRRLAGFGDSSRSRWLSESLEELEEECARTWKPVSPTPDGQRRSPTLVFEGLRDLYAGLSAPLRTPEFVSTLKQEAWAPQPSGSGVLNSQSSNEAASLTHPATPLSSISHTSLVRVEGVSKDEGSLYGGLATALATSDSARNSSPSAPRVRQNGPRKKRLAAGGELWQQVGRRSKVARTKRLMRPLNGSDDGPSTSSGETTARPLAAQRLNSEVAKRFLHVPAVAPGAKRYTVRREHIKLEGEGVNDKVAPALNEVREMLLKPVLFSHDLEALRNKVESLVSRAASSMKRKVSNILASRTLPRVARRFLVFFTLEWASRVMGDDMRKQDWWQTFIGKIPSSYEEKSPRGCSKHIVRLVENLRAAIEAYKQGEAVKDEVALHLIKKTFEQLGRRVRADALIPWANDARLLFTEGAIQEETGRASCSWDPETE